MGIPKNTYFASECCIAQGFQRFGDVGTACPRHSCKQCQTFCFVEENMESGSVMLVQRPQTTVSLRENRVFVPRRFRAWSRMAVCCGETADSADAAAARDCKTMFPLAKQCIPAASENRAIPFHCFLQGKQQVRVARRHRAPQIRCFREGNSGLGRR